MPLRSSDQQPTHVGPHRNEERHNGNRLPDQIGDHRVHPEAVQRSTGGQTWMHEALSAVADREGVADQNVIGRVPDPPDVPHLITQVRPVGSTPDKVTPCATSRSP